MFGVVFFVWFASLFDDFSNYNVEKVGRSVVIPQSLSKNRRPLALTRKTSLVKKLFFFFSFQPALSKNSPGYYISRKEKKISFSIYLQETQLDQSQFDVKRPFSREKTRRESSRKKKEEFFDVWFAAQCSFAIWHGKEVKELPVGSSICFRKCNPGKERRKPREWVFVLLLRCCEGKVQQEKAPLFSSSLRRDASKAKQRKGWGLRSRAWAERDEGRKWNCVCKGSRLTRHERTCTMYVCEAKAENASVRPETKNG